MKISQAKIKEPSDALQKKSILRNQSTTVNILNERNKGEYYLLDIDQLIPFHNQSRMYFDDKNIQELSETIQKHGIRQPLTVIKSQGNLGKYEIISGERRYRAAKNIELQKIPCIILENVDSADEIALIENIQREDLHPIELGRAYSTLYKIENFNTHQKIADKLSISRTQVTEYMAYASLSDEESVLLIKNQISERQILRKLMTIENQGERKKYIENLISKISPDAFLEEPKTIQKNIVRQSNILSIYIKGDELKFKHKPFEKLNTHEKEKLGTKLREIISELEKL